MRAKLRSVGIPVFLFLAFGSFARGDEPQAVGGTNQCSVFGLAEVTMPSGSACQVGDDSTPFGAPQTDPSMESGRDLALCDARPFLILELLDAPLGSPGPSWLLVVVIPRECRPAEGSTPSSVP